MNRRWTYLLVVFLLVGCTSGQQRPKKISPAEPSAEPSVQAQATPVPEVKTDFGYLQVRVRSGASGTNPPIADAEIRVEETDLVMKTDEMGVSPSIQLPTPDVHPVFPTRGIGYYTITVEKNGFKRSINHGFVHGGSSQQDPTELFVYLAPGEGEDVHYSSPVGGRDSPQTPGK